MLCGGLNGKEIQKREDICTHIADSLCCAGESNNTVRRLYSIKALFKKRDCVKSAQAFIKRGRKAFVYTYTNSMYELYILENLMNFCLTKKFVIF